MLTYEKQALSGTIEVLLRSELPDEFEGTKLYGSLEEDNIVVLSDGIVAENGTHEELMKENGLYHRLVDLQTASANWKLSV